MPTPQWLAHLHEIQNKFKSTDKNKVVSTLEIVTGYNATRRSGRTTRQVDFAIDNLFNGNVIICHDHHEEGTSRRANEKLMSLVVTRIAQEHKIYLKGGPRPNEFSPMFVLVGDRIHCTLYLEQLPTVKEVVNEGS